jgi:RNA polymerase sigma-70 factor (ECF subfamily)
MSKEFETHIQSINDKAFRFALKILSNKYEDAQDVVQDLFEKLWEMRENLSKYNNLEAYSMRMVKNLCLDRLKHEKIKAQNHNIFLLDKDLQITENHYDGTNTTEIVKSLIDQLPEKQKMIIHLRDVEGYEFDEIAETMEIDINAVRMNLSRGRKTVKEQLLKAMNYGL